MLGSKKLIWRRVSKDAELTFSKQLVQNSDHKIIDEIKRQKEATTLAQDIKERCVELIIPSYNSLDIESIRAALSAKYVLSDAQIKLVLNDSRVKCKLCDLLILINDDAVTVYCVLNKIMEKSLYYFANMIGVLNGEQLKAQRGTEDNSGYRLVAKMRGKEVMSMYYTAKGGIEFHFFIVANIFYVLTEKPLKNVSMSLHEYASSLDKNIKYWYTAPIKSMYDILIAQKVNFRRLTEEESHLMYESAMHHHKNDFMFSPFGVNIKSQPSIVITK